MSVETCFNHCFNLGTQWQIVDLINAADDFLPLFKGQRRKVFKDFSESH